ncbi:hypothetical protein [Phenylobacterium sp.]|uniref:hypothetical protein n=1 Tax=Phenylobacterium sp. TaxID=1871053 RepID=UPI0037CB96EC
MLFAIGWLGSVTLLSLMSGWGRLSRQFPDRPDQTLANFKFSYGEMRLGVFCILNLTVCEGGLRFGIPWIFGPFDRPFFVPWDQILVEPSPRPLRQRAKLCFGRPPVGQLEISATLADRLARAAGHRWPERLPGDPPA